MGERKKVVIDPAVSSILGDGEKRQAARTMTTSQKKQAARDQARNKLTVDIPEWLEAEIRAAVLTEDCGPSGFVAFLICEGMRAYRQGKRPRKEAARSLKYLYEVSVDEDDIRF